MNRTSRTRLTTVVASAFAILASACSDISSPIATPGFTSVNSQASVAGSDFTVLANQAITCTNGTIIGDVGTFQAPPTGSVTQTSCSIAGGVHVGDGAAVAAYNAFLAEYAALTPQIGDVCTVLSGTLDGVELAPGNYCYPAAATLTGVLTLKGPSNASWTFQIGTSGTGALTGTNFTVLMAGGAQSCNVTWWVAEAATMTTSNFIGTILAGAAITLTGGTFYGDAYSRADVTITGTEVTGCEGRQNSGTPRTDHGKCNQGVGNGPEACDPGNSNNRRTSNDELGGVTGQPGRKGSK
jgi:hypothetical protein